ncbi:hypothetical protein ABPG72_008053 [Tetrahymena utriculariae]
MKEKFEFLHNSVVSSFKNQKQLPVRQKKLQVELKGKKELLDEQQRRQEELEQQVKAIQTELKKQEAEIEMHIKVIDSMQNEQDKIQSSLFEKEMSIQEEEKYIRSKIQGEEDSLKTQIDRLKEELNKRQNTIEFETKHLNEQKLRIEVLKKENEEILNEISNKQNIILQIKDEPDRFQKKADMLLSACNLMEHDLAEIMEEISKRNKTIQELLERIHQYQEKYNEIIQKNQEDQLKIQEDKKSIKTLMDQVKENRLVLEEKLSERYKLSMEIKVKKKEKQNREDLVDTLKNQIELSKKLLKKQENVKKKLKDSIFEQEMSIDKYVKQDQFILTEIKNQESINGELIDENKLTEFKARQITGKTNEKDSQKEQIAKQIVELEQQLTQQQQFEVAANKKIKTLTNMRESMARKASQAMSEVRETREELKIKELSILDLIKRHQETEFNLNAVKALYEEAKSARNKYVNMIQNSSQDLAELKEKIKISQNELEILKNEAFEKSQSLTQYSHTLQLQINLRDRENTHLNKLEFQRVQKKKIVDQNVNEIEKLNVTIQILEKDMTLLRKKYESAQESRNYTGVQLIDKNDELCVLYEKSNIQEKIIKQGEFEIKDIEDEQRMLQIDIDEKKRQIEISLKQIDTVPRLASDVLSLKQELNMQKERYYELSDKLEDPTNKDRWRELGGEDPDKESLDARIKVFEERLNKKKEELLEKELILEEINNLSDKLRSEALDGRQVTLEVTERLNEFQFRLKKITRQMMATISELSMYQAIVIKLQKEREELQEQHEISKLRVQDGKPPTLESELEYQKMLRDKLSYQEERKLRLQREQMEKNFPAFTTITTAEHRVNAYVPDEIGIPKPYGAHAPFKPSTLVNQLRHYKKPEIKDIEI